VPFTELTHPDDLDDSTEAFARLERHEAIEVEKRYLHRDGRAISVLVSATPITTP
jgi:PAS domain S-box-containing protein